MALTNQLPIYKVAYDLLDSVTDSVRSMPRDFKQSIGGKISAECVEIVVLIFRAKRLTLKSFRDYSCRTAATTAVGFGSPESRRTPPQAVFLRPSHGSPSFGRLCGEPYGSPALARSSNLHGRPPVWKRGSGYKSLARSIAMANNAKNPSVEIVKEMFGDHPEDVIGPIKSAADALGWLEEIFITIKNEALIEHNCYRIKQLAEAGAYLALDMSNYAGCQHETYIARLQAAGVVPASLDVRHE